MNVEMLAGYRQLTPVYRQLLPAYRQLPPAIWTLPNCCTIPLAIVYDLDDLGHHSNVFYAFKN